LQQFRRALFLASFAFVAFAIVRTGCAYGQASPTATQSLTLSVFGGVNGTFTGVGLGRDAGITAGFDAGVRPFFGWYPALEVRGTYPFDHGSIDYQRNVLGGVVFSRHLYERYEPYGDILVGRGQINFVTPYPNPSDTTVYEQTASAVISPGAGINVRLGDHFAAKGDFQFQHYDSPVTPSGSVYSKAFTLGVVYRLSFGGLGHGRR
jgi:hypothetical protein